MTGRPASGERGMILLAVLWITALMTVVVVALSAFAQKNAGMASLEATRLRTEMTLEAGFEMAKAMIAAMPAEQRVFFDGRPVQITLGGARTAAIAIQDAAGLIDINRADPELIKAFASRLESGDPAQAMLAAALETRASLARSAPKPAAPVAAQADGQESEKKEAAVPPPVFIAAQQLYGLGGADPASVDKILPFITLYGADGKINPMAAPDTVLSSIPGLPPGSVADIVAARRQKQRNAGAVQQAITQAPGLLAIGEPRIFRVDVRLTSGGGVIAGSHLQATVVFDEAGAPPFQVLSWSW